MEMKTLLSGNPLSCVRLLLASILLVGIVTGGNLWIHSGDPPLGMARYTGFGFSIDHSSLMFVQEMGFAGGVATESTGMMQGTYEGKSLEQFGVIWFKPNQLPSHYDISNQDALLYIFEQITSFGTVITNIGEEQETTVNGHDVHYVTFDLEESLIIPGVLGAWYCQESDMFMVLYLVYLPDLEQFELHSSELENMWLDYLNTVNCHEST